MRFGSLTTALLASAFLTGLGFPALAPRAEAQVIITPPVVASPFVAPPRIYVRPPVIRVRRWYRPGVVYVPGPRVYVGPPRVYQAPPMVYQPPPPPPVQYNYPPPPPPYQPPPPPVVYSVPQPPPVVYAIPPAPPPVYAIQTPPPILSQWGPKLGLGGRFGVLINSDPYDRFSELGFGGELLYRATRHLSLEFAGEYQKSVDNSFARYDVPMTLGLRIHIGAPNWVVSPYFVVAGGMDYANLDFLAGHDTGWFIEGQAGGGLELRLGRHMALTADVRADGRHRVTDPTEAVTATTSVDGKPFQPMTGSVGAQMRFGAAVYF